MIRSWRGTAILAALVMASLLSCPPARAQATPPPELGTGPEVGKRAPDFTLPSLAGDSIRLADLRGKVVLLNFWSTWCRPCRREMPSMQRAYERLRPRGFAILAVSLNQETDGTVPDFARAGGFTFTFGLDPGEEVADLYRVHDLPTSFLLARDGRIAHKLVGHVDWDGPRAVALMAGLLAPCPVPADFLIAEGSDRW